MIKVFYGENRVAAVAAAKRILGENYEVVEGAELTANDLPNLFWGTTFFSDTRAILVRDLLANKTVVNDLGKYLNTKHNIILLETKIDKRANVYKELSAQVEFTEFKMPRDMNAGIVFNIYNTAKRDGRRAVKMVEQIEQTQDPIMFEGLMISQALKDFAARPGEQEKRALLRLSQLDIKLKSSSIDAWTLIKAFLLT